MPSRSEINDVRHARPLVLRDSIWSVADQAVVSLGTFLTSIVLARHLSPKEYGLYSVLMASFLFLNGIHTALVCSPLSVQGAAASATRLKRQSTISLLFTLGLTVPASLALLLGTRGLGAGSLWVWSTAYLGLWQLQETLRRSLMAGLGHRRAIVGDAVSYLGQAGLVWAVCRGGSASLETALVVMALTSGAAALLQAIQTGLTSVSLGDLREFSLSHWHFGSWILYGSLATALSAQAFFWVLAFFHGPTSTASFQAASNVLGMCHPLMFGLGNLLMPVIARANSSGGHSSAWRATTAYGVPFGCVLFLFFGVALTWPRVLLEILYGSTSPYMGLQGLVRLLVVTYIFIFGAHLLGLFLTGIGDSRAVFQTQLWGAVSALAVGLPMAWAWGLSGACLGMVAVNGGRFAACIRYATRAWGIRQTQLNEVRVNLTA